MPLVTEEAILKLGLIQSSNAESQIDRTCYTTNIKRFKASYYACPKTVLDTYFDVQKEEFLGNKRIKKPKVLDLLLGFRFLKLYQTKHALTGPGNCTEKTALNQVWKYVFAIQALGKFFRPID